METLRKWARRGTVPTYLQPTNIGTSLRLVDLEGVQARAAELGRDIQTDPAPGPEPVAIPASAETVPPGTMIVPVDAWNKMLSQLGNLHEAGQQLAAARERAAKAETEAQFLRERLAEIRKESAPAEITPPTETPGTEEATADRPQSPPPPPEKVWRYLVRRVRARTGRDRKPG